jgi:hypothetical protein
VLTFFALDVVGGSVVVVVVVVLTFFALDVVGGSVVVVVVVVVVVLGATYLSVIVFAFLSVHLPSSKPLSNIQDEAASMVRVVNKAPRIFLQKVRVFVCLFVKVLVAFFPSLHSPFCQVCIFTLSQG